MRPNSYAAITMAALAVLSLSCGNSTWIQDELKKPDKTLQVVVSSHPPGAEVYGVKRGHRGDFLGVTPLTCSYMLMQRGNSPTIVGTVPVEQTIVSTFELLGFANEDSYYSFQCLVERNGYSSAHVVQELKDDRPFTPNNFSTSDVFRGGRSIEVLVELEPLDSADTAGFFTED